MAPNKINDTYISVWMASYIPDIARISFIRYTFLTIYIYLSRRSAPFLFAHTCALGCSCGLKVVRSEEHKRTIVTTEDFTPTEVVSSTINEVIMGTKGSYTSIHGVKWSVHVGAQWSVNDGGRGTEVQTSLDSHNRGNGNIELDGGNIEFDRL